MSTEVCTKGTHMGRNRNICLLCKAPESADHLRRKGERQEQRYLGKAGAWYGGTRRQTRMGQSFVSGNRTGFLFLLGKRKNKGLLERLPMML